MNLRLFDSGLLKAKSAIINKPQSYPHGMALLNIYPMLQVGLPGFDI